MRFDQLRMQVEGSVDEPSAPWLTHVLVFVAVVEVLVT